ncbi:MAG: RlmE family RNA methyltransferase [Gammaproteobacteria bacterium]|nr:RlmE family RNA methyltransferase [Gammaproteobacteria bacterium]HJP34808.1 RlmE family RNA methyltransferase [Gammaproteobacteria bacterium]
MTIRRSSTRQWVRKQASDPYVKQRDAAGFRSRSAFKLKEILKRDRLITKGCSVLDLGASPGGWTQVALEAVGPRGMVVGVDLLPMDPVAGAHFIEGDCRETDMFRKIRSRFGERGVDLVISDIAPNITGIRDVDEANVLEIAGVVRELSTQLLVPQGSMLIKLFQFPGTDSYIADLKDRFSSIVRRKPESSRRTSREFYVVAKGFGI